MACPRADQTPERTMTKVAAAGSIFCSANIICPRPLTPAFHPRQASTARAATRAARRGATAMQIPAASMNPLATSIGTA